MNTADINPTLLRIWEKERQMNLSGGNDRHVGWLHSFIYRMALEMTDEQKTNLNNQLAHYLSQLEMLAANG